VQNFTFRLPEEQKDIPMVPLQGFVLGCPPFKVVMAERQFCPIPA